MPAEPLYKKYPELYSYNTETQRHISKSSKVFKRLVITHHFPKCHSRHFQTIQALVI